MNRPASPRLARRMSYIRPFHVMDLLARARHMESQGRCVIHMEVGEPDFPTPQPIVDAGMAALRDGHTHYTPAAGLPRLREAIAGHYHQRFGLDIDPNRVMVTPGSSGAIQLVMDVLVDVGDKVLLPDPGYPCNRHFVRLAEGTPVALDVTAENAYQPSVEQVVNGWDDACRMLMVATPSNPTGTCLSQAQMRQLSDAVVARDGVLVVDEIYQGLVYAGEEFSALALAESPIVINSFSKFFGMTGWRLGWAVAPLEVVEAMDRLAQNIFLAPSTPAQHAALAAFSPETAEILAQRREAFAERRDFLLEALQQLGFRFPARPAGAFYLYADSGAITDDSFAFAQRLLDEAGVAVTPGLDFGDNQPQRHIRFAYTNTIEKLEQGVERIARFIAR